MNRKLLLATLLVTALMACLGGYEILRSDLPVTATGDLLVKVGKALFYSSGALAIVFLALLFFPRAFPVWKRFAVWFVPLAAILFAVYPEPGSGDFFSPYPEQIFQWVSALYVAISAVIIARFGFESRT